MCLYLKHSILNEMRQSRFFYQPIKQILKNDSPEHEITRDAIDCINVIICRIATRIAEKSREFMNHSINRTLSKACVENSVKLLIPGELGKMCLINELQPGLVRPGLATSFLRDFGNLDIRVSRNSILYLSNVLEYLIHDILESAIEICICRIRIRRRDLIRGIAIDSNLSCLLRQMGFLISPKELFIPKATFKNLIKTFNIPRITSDALDLLQDYSEVFVAGLVENARKIAVKRITKREIDILMLLKTMLVE